MLLSNADALPIADAFKLVLAAKEYRGMWITAFDFTRIMNFEFGLTLPTVMISAETLISALARDVRFKTAAETNGASGVFRNVYTPRILQSDGKTVSNKVFCYFAVITKGSNPVVGEGKWFDQIPGAGHLCKKRCSFKKNRC